MLQVMRFLVWNVCREEELRILRGEQEVDEANLRLNDSDDDDLGDDLSDLSDDQEPRGAVGKQAMRRGDSNAASRGGAPQNGRQVGPCFWYSYTLCRVHA